MHTTSQLFGLEQALERQQEQPVGQPYAPIEGLGAFGRSSHGGASAPLRPTR